MWNDSILSIIAILLDVSFLSCRLHGPPIVAMCLVVLCSISCLMEFLRLLVVAKVECRT